MSGYVFVLGPCAVCDRVFSYNPHKVPSFNNDGVCEPCMVLVNARRVENGLDPHPVAADAYEAIPEGEL